MVGAPEARQHLAETAGAVQLRLALGAFDGALQAPAEETLLLWAGGGQERRAVRGPVAHHLLHPPRCCGVLGGRPGGPRRMPAGWPLAPGGQRLPALSLPPPSLRKVRLAHPRQERPVSPERLAHMALGGLGLFPSRNSPHTGKTLAGSGPAAGDSHRRLGWGAAERPERPNWQPRPAPGREGPLAMKDPPEGDPFSGRQHRPPT